MPSACSSGGETVDFASGLLARRHASCCSCGRRRSRRRQGSDPRGRQRRWDGGPRADAASMPGLDWVDWSPDSRQIAFLSDAVADGAKADQRRRMSTGAASTTRSTWAGRPTFPVVAAGPLGAEIVFRGEQLTPADAPPGLFAVHPDGSGLRQSVTDAAVERSRFDTDAGGRPGRHAGELHERRRLRGIHPCPRPRDRPRQRHARSRQWLHGPMRCGVLLAGRSSRSATCANYSDDETYQFVVAPSDGSGTGTPIGPRLRDTDRRRQLDLDAGRHRPSWSTTAPTGTVRLLPIDGSPGTVIGKGDLAFADIQRLAP